MSGVRPTDVVNPRGLTPRRSHVWATRLLVTGGVLSALNGVAHFALPVYYPWGEHVEDLYEAVSWALYATTVFFGVLLALAGVLVVAVAQASDVPRRVLTWVAGGMAFFWLVGAVYEVIVPFPAPIASWVLPVFSMLVAVLFLSGLWLRQPSSTDG